MEIRFSTVKNLPFVWENRIEIEEGSHGKRFTGILASEGVSRNGNVYTLETLESIANQANGLPLYYGTVTRINPNTGRLTKNMHDLSGSQIGKIVKAWVEGKVVKFIGEVFESFTGKIGKGWGLSLSGKSLAHYSVDAAGRVLTHLKNFVLKSAQLLEPHTPRGMESAKVLEVEESFLFEAPKLSVTQIAAILAAYYKYKG
jgi:hypothetical protein